VSLEARQVCFIGRQTTAGGNDGFITPGQFFDDSLLPFAEGGFAVVLEYFLNGCARSRLDNIIGVQKRKMQGVRHQSAHRGFSGSHEADKRKVPDLAGAVHANVIPELRLLRTQFLRGKGRASGQVAKDLLAQDGLAAVKHLHFVVNEIFFRQRLHHLAALIVESTKLARFALR